jgi:hypothetical protein
VIQVMRGSSVLSVGLAVVTVVMWAFPGSAAAAAAPLTSTYSGIRVTDPSNFLAFEVSGQVDGTLGRGTFTGWEVLSYLPLTPTTTITTTTVYPEGTLTQTASFLQASPPSATSTITGGTGIFAGASGSTTISPPTPPGNYAPGGGPFSFTSTGTITFARPRHQSLTWAGPVLIDPPAPAGANFSPLDGISCPRTRLCVASGGGGDAVVSTDPIDAAWTPTGPLDGSGFDSVACPGGALCVLVDDQGAVVISKSPVRGPWSSRIEIDLPTNPPGFNALTSVACPSVRLCVTVDQRGRAFTSTHPAGGASAWSPAVRIDGLNDIFTVSCARPTLCVAGDIAGNIITSTAPTAGASAWSVRAVDPGHWIDSISCASRRLCVAVDNDGQALVSTDPTGGPGAWRAEAIAPPGRYITAVSCVRRRHGRAPLCVAVDVSGNAYMTSAPELGAPAWSSTNISSDPLTAVSCPTPARCVAVSAVGTAIVAAASP